MSVRKDSFPIYRFAKTSRWPEPGTVCSSARNVQPVDNPYYSQAAPEMLIVACAALPLSLYPGAPPTPWLTNVSRFPVVSHNLPAGIKYFCRHMFRYITVLFLLTAFAAQTFRQAVIVLNYSANTASFSRHCENKARPVMHCNGKCQLMKKMQDEEKSDRPVPERKLENKTEVVSSLSFFATILFTQPQARTLFGWPQVPSVCDGSFSQVFRPPTVSTVHSVTSLAHFVAPV